MKIKLKPIVDGAMIPFKTHSSDFCYDVVAVSEEEVLPGVWRYGLGFALEIERKIPNSGCNVSIDFRPRSSIYKTGMVLCNSCGTIDESYRGEIAAYFYHVIPSLPRYQVGDKIGQIKIGTTVPMEFEIVDELTETDRGEGGFGSTGK